MSNVIPFERIRDVSGWPIWQIRVYVKQKNWKNFRIKYSPDGDVTKIVRLPDDA